MKKVIHLAVLAAMLAGSALMAQQPAPTQPRQQPPPGNPPPAEAGPERQGPPGFGGGRRGMMGGPGAPGAPAEMGPRGFGPGVPFSPTALLERRAQLNLTADQVTRLSNLENEARAAREKAENDVKPHREELQKIMEQATPDVAQIRTHFQAMSAAQQAAQLSMLTTTAQAKAVLNAEQRGRVQGWAEARRDGGPQRRMMAPGRRPGGFGMRRTPRRLED